MGSCENSTCVDEPLHGSAIEQHSCPEFREEPFSEQRLCLEEGCNLIDSNVETNNNAPDGCPGLARDLSIGCDVVESTCVGSRDGSVGECENVGGLGSEELLDDECGVSGDCLKEGTSGVDDCEGKTGGLCLANVGGLGSENLLDDGCGASGDCLKESTSGADGLCLEKEESRGEYGLINLLEGCKMSLEVMTTTGLPRDCVQEEEQEDEKSVSGLPEVGFMEEKSDALAGLDTDTHDQPSSSKACEMPSKLIPTTGSPRNCVQEDGQKDDMSTSALSVGGVMEVMEDQSHVLAKIKKDIRDQMLPSQGSEMPSESITVTLARNCIQQDEQKDDKTVNGPSAEAVMEDQSDVSAKIKKDTQDQMLPSQDCEMPSESIPLTCLLRSYVQQDKQKDDKSVNGPPAEPVMEDKSDVLPGIETGSQSCEVPLDLITVTGLPRSCVQQDKQKDDKSISGPSTEGIMELQEEKHDVLARIETDKCDQKSPSRACEMPLKLIPMSGSPSSCAQKNEQMDSNGVSGLIAESGVDGKSDAFNGNKVDMGNRKSFSHDGVMPSKLSCMRDLVSSCDGNTSRKSVSGLHAERVSEVVETKCVMDTVIVALPAQRRPKSLKNIRMADKLSDCAQLNERRVNKSVSVPSTESFPEVVEEKSDIATGLKVKISSRILPVEDNGCNSKDGSFEVAPSCFVEKSGSKNCSEQTENEGKVSVGVDRVSETKCPGIVLSSSRRSSRISRSTQKTPRKGAARKCRNTAKMPRPDQSTENIFKAARRKRSCISKPARSSIWGEVFKHSDVLGINQIQNHGLLEAKGVQGSGMQNKNQAGGSSWGSSGKCRASGSCLRLKVKLGKNFVQDSLNIMVPEVADTSASANAINSDYGTELYQGTSFEFPKLDSGVQDKLGEEGTERQFPCFNKNLDKVKTYSDASLMDVHLENNDLEGSVISDKFAGDAADDYLGIPSHIVVEELEGATENRYIDPGTSPDSEVINLVPDAQVGARPQDDLHDAVLTSKTLAAPGDVISSKRGKKKDKLPDAANCILEDRVPGASINKAKPSKKRGGRRKTDDGFNCSEGLTSSTSTNASSNSLSSKEFSVKPLPLSRDTDLGVSGGALKVESGAEANICCSQNVGLGLSELHNSKNMLASAKSEGHQLPKSSKSNRVSKGRSKVSDSAKSRRQNASRQRGSQRKLVTKSKVKENGACDQVGYRVDGYPETGNHVADDNGNRNTGDGNASVDLANLDVVSGGVVEQCFPLDNAWVSCDDCHKWRRIPVVLADSLGEHCRWVCKDNMDKAYADCSIPQEKSNADINAELGISDAEEDAYNGRLNYKGSEKGLEYRHITVPQQSIFSRIDSNEFLHRSRKTQTIDEIMVCHCKPPQDGQLGCGDECLNRMLNIECVQGTCPCGDLCSNQQFQKRKYASMKWTRCGRKGHGLQLLEDISKGQFLIEYVGEVLDMHAYEERQKEYALKSHKHFYFMTLNGSEVIDACAKGNLGRFINHSCDPNCRTEKWMVNGEICIGLFALRDIKKDEEVTFDYNYVRAFGAAAKKCFCGSPHCRGYIGGDLLNTEVIVQGDSDEEYPEPVMLEDGETWDGLDQVISRASSFNGAEMQIAESISIDRDKMDKFTTAVGQLEITTEIEDSVNRSGSTVSQLHSSVEMEDLKGKFSSSVEPVEMSIQTEDITNKPSSAGQKESIMDDETMDKTSCAIQRVETSSATMMLSKSSSDGIDVNRKPRSDTVEDKRIFRKSRFRLKKSHSSGSVKKGKVSSNPPNGNKVQMIANKADVLSLKPKKVMEGSSNGRFEAVQEKLNELLVADGGISKRKDAPKGYLKLLLLTAASGDSGNGEAIQSNRDLSMILDALLKTKSRVVLTDIINKNGLRMLHNIMKQYRRDFKKIPILRKLLKVLEYLAMREILTLEHINGGPPCPGMESFRESILSLTEHDDKQVHQIARNFRDRWIPRPVRKLSYMDRDDGRVEFQRGSNCNRVSTSQNHWRDQGVRSTEAIDCVMQSVRGTTSADSTVGCSTPCTVSCPTNGTKTRKRKSRWDQPAETNPDSRSLQHKEQKIDGSINTDDGRQNIHEDVPPGFSSPLNAPLVSSNASSTATDLHLKCPFDVVIGHPQQKFISRLPVSYGVPLPIVQQFGSPQADTVESWAIAPGMPFHPFPPLPPFPRDRKETPTCAVSMTIDEPAQQGQRNSCGPATCFPDENSPRSTGADLSDMDISGGNIQQTFKRARGSSHDLCKRYFRQQKWNKNKMGPPWLWRRNGQGYMGNNSRGGTCSTDVGNVTNELRSSYSSEDISCGVEKASNDFYQHPLHHNQH